jgi:cell division protein FtsQ
MYRALEPALKPLDVALDSLTLDARGSWTLVLDNDALLELGGGTTEDILQRVQRFVRTLPQITSQYKRSAAALESADLRYEDGYALRLKGVTTGTSAPATAARARR